MKALLVTLVFAPLLGAAVAGLFGRRIGDKPSMALTTGLLFLSCALSWYTFVQVAWGAWTRLALQYNHVDEGPAGRESGRNCLIGRDPTRSGPITLGGSPCYSPAAR